MTEPAKKTVAKKEEVKTVPLADLVAYKEASKSREKKLQEQLEDQTTRITELETNSEIAQADEGDEGVSNVKRYLLDENKKLVTDKAAHGKSVTSLSEREKKVRAREIVADYKERGVELDVETLQDESDMERFALDRYSVSLAEKSTEKGKETEDSSAPEQFFETGPVVVPTLATIENVDVSTIEGRALMVKIEKDLASKVSVK